MSFHPNNFPKLHNAMWPGLVGKGSPGAEPCIDLDTMLNLTAAAEVDGVKFDGVDIFLFDPHINIDISDDDLKRLAGKIAAKNLVVGSVVAPIWPPTGGGSAMGGAEDRQKFAGQVRKGCRIASKLRAFGVRPYGIVRIDSACGVEEWSKDPDGNTRRIAGTFREACAVAEGFGERLAAEGEICWGGMHSWREMVKLLELVGRPKTLGFQADMAHTLLYALGYNAPESRIVPENFNWDPAQLDAALKTLTAALRPWTIDLHIAQNDATVKGSGTHDKTGRHCLPTDPNGKLDIARVAGHWMRDASGEVTKAFRHVCWDGCMFPNDVMMKPETWNSILAAMLAVRDAHGWRGVISVNEPTKEIPIPVRVVSKPAKKRAAKKPARKAARKPARKPAKKAKAKKAAKRSRR
ncbi:MAG: TIM barrel protein [Verrucomicrobia bacterium]|nr:TIM barrel protein [Verrucomicrobiota bacterium]